MHPFLSDEAKSVYAALEGFELPDFLDFQAWCIAERDRSRSDRSAILAELVRRHRARPLAHLDS